MKMRREHLVPLSPQAAALVEELLRATNGDHLFPHPTRAGVISENRILYALYRMGFHSRATVHGFRGTASTVLHEKGFESEWIERQLAHIDANTVRAAYNSAKYLPQRREMMAWWSDYLDEQAEIARLLN